MTVYEKEILKVLTEVGERGLKVEKIAHHVFNACNTMFHPIAYADVHAYVARYLHTQSQRKGGTVVRKEGEWGVYCLNTCSPQSRQLMLEFGAEEDEEKPQTDDVDLSLSLF